MRIRLAAALLAAATLLAQDATHAAPDDKAARSQKARELLEKIDTTLGAVEPEVSVVVLNQLAGAWKPFDPKHAVACLQQAFAGASALPEDEDRHARSKMQAEIIKSAVLVDLAEACQLLRTMPAAESREAAADAVISALLDKKEYDTAMETLALTPPDADYPYAGSQRLFEELPKDDSRRLLVFGNAAAAYCRRPGDDFRPFLGKHWREVPRETAQTALASVLRVVLDAEDEPASGESLETSKGTVKLAGRKSMQLFDLLDAIRALDPVRYKLLLEQYADLSAAAKLFPDGRQSVDMSGTFHTVAQKNSGGSSWNSNYNSDFDLMPPLSMFDVAPEKLQDTMRDYVAAQKKAGEAFAAFQKDHIAGLNLADNVSEPYMHASLLLQFAEEVKKDHAAAASLLSKAQSLISDIPNEGDRLGPSISVAELQHELNNDKAAWEAMEHGAAGLVASYKSDTNSDRPNRALREFWPSTLGCRYLMYSAEKIFGTRVEDLLPSLTGPDLVLMAQVELARALMGASIFASEHATASFQVLH
jgi:hypothetical protein